MPTETSPDSAKFLSDRRFVRAMAYTFDDIWRDRLDDERMDHLADAIDIELQQKFKRPILEEVMELTADLRRASDGDAHIIGADHRDPDYRQKVEDVADKIGDNINAKIREYLGSGK